MKPDHSTLRRALASCFALFVALFPLVVAAAAPTATAPVATADAGVAGKFTFSSSVETNGGTTSVVFRYGIGNKELTARASTLSDAAGAQTATATVSNLIGGKTYQIEVVATNADGSVTTAGADFTVAPYKPRIISSTATPKLSGKAELAIVLTANGADTNAVFSTGTANLVYDVNTQTVAPAATAAESEKKVTVNLEGLIRGRVYHWKAEATNSVGVTDNLTTVAGVTSDLTFTATANKAPIARADSVTLTGKDAITIDVLANDSDPEGDGFELVSVSKPKAGTAEIVGGKIVYEPRDGANGPDTFTYTVRDNFLDATGTGASATGTVTVRLPALASQGLHSVQLKDEDGNVVGLVRIVGTGEGALSGKVHLHSQTFAFTGRLDADGALQISIPGKDGKSVTLDLAFDQSASPKLTADVRSSGEKYTGETTLTPLSSSRREQLVGQYTLKIPALGSSTNATLPQGVGAARIAVMPWGEVTMKGTLGDGTKFSTKGVIGGASDTTAAVNFWFTPKNSRIGMTVNFAAGEAPALTGSMNWYRQPRSGSDFFPEGFLAQPSPTGSQYTAPDKGQRVLGASTDTATLTLTDGNLSAAITHQIEINKAGKVYVRDQGSEDLTVKIDTKKGTFKGEFTHPIDGDRRKFSGVLVQRESTGSGVFKGATQTGSVQLTLGFTPAPVTPAPTPAPTTPGTGGTGNNTGGNGIDLGIDGLNLNKAPR